MEYCGPVLQGAYKTDFQNLDAIQRRACRLMGNSNDIIYKLNVQSLNHRRNVSGLCQIYHMVSGVAPCKVCQLLPSFCEPI